MKSKSIFKKGLTGLALCMTLFSYAMANEGFPLRSKYPEVSFISTEDLHRDYEKVVIVDVRSAFEFDVVRINKAVNIPVAKGTFEKELEKLRSETGKQPIVFYCNGRTCAKSYKATKKALVMGINEVFVYDAGIFEWVDTYPEKGTLMGTTPTPKEKLIPKAALQKKMLDYNDFKRRAGDPNSIVIDIREPFQRKIKLPLPNTRNIPSDRLKPLVANNLFKEKELLIFDAVGKQVRWLQYHLESNGYKNYYFLKGGVREASKQSKG